MAIECAYSFSDLFLAANKKSPTSEELDVLYALPQNERNKTVKIWAQIAGWEIKERLGHDGQIYFAFAPTFKT